MSVNKCMNCFSVDYFPTEVICCMGCMTYDSYHRNAIDFMVHIPRVHI